MDVIAGKAVLETEVKQHSARFKLDYSQVQCATSRPFYLELLPFGTVRYVTHSLSCTACHFATTIMSCTVHCKQNMLSSHVRAVQPSSTSVLLDTMCPYALLQMLRDSSPGASFVSSSLWRRKLA